MADARTMNGELSEDQTVNIVGDDVSEYKLKIAELSDEMAVLEKEKNQVLHENKTLSDRIRKMKESIESLSVENEGLKEEVENLGSEKEGLQAVVARAADLEGEVSRLQHDLITTMSDLQDANGVIAGLKSKLGSSEEGGLEKATQMDAIVSERDSLVAKVKGLEAEVAKEAEVKGLESRIVELEIESGEKAREKDGLEKKVRELEGNLAEKDAVIRGFEVDGGVIGNGKAAAAVRAVEEDAGSVAEGRKKDGSVLDGLKKMEWPVVAAAATGSAVAVMGLVCYLRYSRRN